jgi:hypothetical protein
MFIQKRLLVILPLASWLSHLTSESGWDVARKKHPQQCGIVVDRVESPSEQLGLQDATGLAYRTKLWSILETGKDRIRVDVHVAVSRV